MKYNKYELIMKKVKVHDVKKEYDVTCSQDVFEFATKVLKMNLMPVEHFLILALASSGEIIGYTEISKGGINSAEASARSVFQAAISMNASSIICIHNHPSGRPVASQQDIDVTKKLVEAGHLMEIPVIDHIIVGDGCYTSLRSEGYIL